MRLLGLVGPTEDGTGLVLESDDGRERFNLPIDDQLRVCMTPPTPEPEPVELPTDIEILSPREIQTKVRAGHTPQAIAAASGTPIGRVMRFARPVLAERERVASEARRSRARHGSEGQLALFGDLIDSRLAALNLEPSDAVWDAFRRHDGGWTVTITFNAAGGELVARFSVGLANRTVSSLNDVGADLLSDGPTLPMLQAWSDRLRKPAPRTEFDTIELPPALNQVPSMPRPIEEAAAPAAAAWVNRFEFNPSNPADSTSDEPLPAATEEPIRLTAVERQTTTPALLRPPWRRQKSHTASALAADALTEDDSDSGFSDFSDGVGRDGGPLGRTYDPNDAQLHHPAFTTVDPAEEPFDQDVRTQSWIDSAGPTSLAVDGSELTTRLDLADLDRWTPTDPGIHEPEQLDLGLVSEIASVAGPAEVTDLGDLSDHDEHSRRVRRSADKPRMPSWDDILLGVRHKTD